MKKYWLILILILAAGFCQAQSESGADQAGNLFTPKAYHNPYVDHIARNVGDILTVIISENTSSTHSASTSLSKTDNNSITNALPLLAGLFGLASDGVSSSNSGSGSTSNIGNLTAQMSVRVTKVLSNGVLVIQGTRSIMTNRNLQTFKLTGEVRSEDVLSNNSILSSSIEDAKIVVNDKGSIADRQRRGILTRIIDWLF